jgi:hypothetical protein
MMIVAAALLIGFLIGFVCGYGVRDANLAPSARGIPDTPSRAIRFLTIVRDRLCSHW